jgi:hypothetical protein
MSNSSCPFSFRLRTDLSWIRREAVDGSVHYFFAFGFGGGATIFVSLPPSDS